MNILKIALPITFQQSISTYTFVQSQTKSEIDHFHFANVSAQCTPMETIRKRKIAGPRVARRSRQARDAIHDYAFCAAILSPLIVPPISTAIARVID